MAMEEKVVQVYKDELLHIVDEFHQRIIEGTADPDRFLTIFDIERLWTGLRGDTSHLYSEMLTDILGGIDESELIRKKKRNTGEKV
jgi:hypothetical protein